MRLRVPGPGRCPRQPCCTPSLLPPASRPPSQSVTRGLASRRARQQMERSLGEGSPRPPTCPGTPNWSRVGPCPPMPRDAHPCCEPAHHGLAVHPRHPPPPRLLSAPGPGLPVQPGGCRRHYPICPLTSSRPRGPGPLGGVQVGSEGLPASLKAHHWRPCPCSVGWYLV